MRTVVASFCFAALIGAAPVARADWACTVLLCMLNPNGPMAVSACVAPIKQLWRHLARGRAWPTCEGANNSVVRITGTGPYYCHPSLLIPHEEYTASFRCTARYSLQIDLDGKPQARAWFDIENSPEQAVTEFLGEGGANAGRQ